MESLIFLIFTTLIIIVIYVFCEKVYSKKDLLCECCGYHGKFEQNLQGNSLIELVLWLSFIVPGIIYSIWRNEKNNYICPKCNSKLVSNFQNAIRIDSLKAKEVLEKKNNVKCPFCAEDIKQEAIVCKHCGNSITSKQLFETSIDLNKEKVNVFVQQPIKHFKNVKDEQKTNTKIFKDEMDEIIKKINSEDQNM